MARKKVFISHVSTETDVAQYLKQRLDRDFLGLLDIFVSSDRQTIAAGAKWLEEVEKALKSADLQIVLCSKESVGRPWVNFEAGAVWLRGIPVIPVCHSGLKLTDLPIPLSMLEGIEGGKPEGLKQLYEALAAKLKLKVPVIDFHTIANEIRELEKKYLQARQSPERIERPRVLCAASEQFATLGFDLDVAVLKRMFPEQLTVEPKLTRKRLSELLTGERFDIVHLVLAVDPDNGDLMFSPVEFQTLKPTTARPDKLSAEAFADLLIEAQTSLVVLATCKAMLLAVEVAHVANMAASDAVITGEAAAEWEECFYGFLAQGKSLYKAFDLTRSQVATPIRPIRHKDIAFGPTVAGPR